VLFIWRRTFAGYIKLDDTATYLAMLDRYLDHGYNVAGLAPSTYERTLTTSLSTGYPMGSLMPLGAGHKLLGTDAAWLWQPYLCFLAAMIALGLYVLAAPLVRARPLRAFGAAVAASAALLYGYALWGGIKELAMAMLLVLVAALLPTFVRAPGWRNGLPLAVVGAATVGAVVGKTTAVGAGARVAVGTATGAAHAPNKTLTIMTCDRAINKLLCFMALSPVSARKHQTGLAMCAASAISTSCCWFAVSQR